MASSVIKRANTVSASYTPSITANNTGFTTANEQFVYLHCGGLLLISGRFQITNAGTGSSNIFMSLPTGFSANVSGVGGCGTVVTDSAGAADYMPRVTSGNAFIISKGAGGNYSLPSIGTGYVAVFAVITLA